MITIFAKNLREARERKQITRRDFAQQLHITAQTYGAYELGQREPRFDILLKISELLGVSLDWLLKGDNAKAKTAYDAAIANCKAAGYEVIENNDPDDESEIRVKYYDNGKELLNVPFLSKKDFILFCEHVEFVHQLDEIRRHVDAYNLAFSSLYEYRKALKAATGD